LGGGGVEIVNEVINFLQDAKNEILVFSLSSLGVSKRTNPTNNRSIRRTFHVLIMLKQESCASYGKCSGYSLSHPVCYTVSAKIDIELKLLNNMSCVGLNH
jgi:hypothetical protein